MRTPKFRNTARLLLWMKRHGWGERLPSHSEQVFFNSKKEDPSTIAVNLATYAWVAGKLELPFESVLKNSPMAVVDYAKMLLARVNEKISEDLQDSLKGCSAQLVQLAQVYKERLPARLEDTICEPYWALDYAKSVLRGRLPSHLECVFFKDPRIASRYAFEVIRGFSPVMLPDELHSFMIMKSFENPDDDSIKRYIEASESDPSKIGNH